MADKETAELMQTLAYPFKDPAILDEALRHSSFVNEQTPPLSSNERLEFLGDSVLNLVVSQLLMEQFPKMEEGPLSRLRASLVNESRLADIATHIGLGAYIQLGKGEIRTRGSDKKSILSDCYEAVLAAVYLDGGFGAAFALIQAHFADLIKSSAHADTFSDYKTQVQEVIQKAGHPPPVYRVTAETGPDHDKTFCVVMQSTAHTAEGTGKSKKAAEQDAARKALAHLSEASRKQ